MDGDEAGERVSGIGATSFRRAVAVRLTVFLGLAVVALASCSDGETVTPCTGIPLGGCPRSRGVACEDPACEAVYRCRPNNVWELEERCPQRDLPARDAAADDASTLPDASSTPPLDAALDAPPGANGGPGCGPLQLPDCALGFALACPSGCCGCEDLFVCESGGWSLWGTCSPDAGVHR